jgi:hypothetical protein
VSLNQVWSQNQQLHHIHHSSAWKHDENISYSDVIIQVNTIKRIVAM